MIILSVGNLAEMSRETINHVCSGWKIRTDLGTDYSFVDLIKEGEKKRIKLKND